MKIQAGDIQAGDRIIAYCNNKMQICTVKRVQLPTDRETGRLRGFAFVEMATDAEENAAIEALDGAEWMGRDLKGNYSG